MRAILVPTFLVLVAAAAASSSYNFETYVKTFQKQYGSPLEATMRREAFSRNRQFIEKFNANSGSFRLGYNHLMDLTDEEMSSRLTGGRNETKSTHENSARAEALFASLMSRSEGADNIPDELDWSAKEGVVTEVSDQGACQSDYAFTAAGVLEGQLRLKGRSLVPLSKQMILDCTNNFQCLGGDLLTSWMDIFDWGGLVDEKCYPYKAKPGTGCRFNQVSSHVLIKVSGVYRLPLGDEDLLKRVVATYGPVGVEIDATPKSFQLYKSGVWLDSRCNKDIHSLNQHLVLVGYGKDAASGLDYWKLKNSWGTQWGEGGYIRMARNRENSCGIATKAMIPLVE